MAYICWSGNAGLRRAAVYTVNGDDVNRRVCVVTDSDGATGDRQVETAPNTVALSK